MPDCKDESGRIPMDSLSLIIKPSMEYCFGGVQDVGDGRAKIRVSDDDTYNASIKQSRKRRAIGADLRGENADSKHWSKESHRAFVSSIYDIGVKHASPSVILENMHSKPEFITSERVKSHLQKYRVNRSKGKTEFLKAYDDWMLKALHLQNCSEKKQLVSPLILLEMISSKSLLSGDLAAFLSYSVMTESENEMSRHVPEDDHVIEFPLPKDNHADYIYGGMPLVFPELTDSEMNSPLGQSLCYVKTVFSLMKNQIEELREMSSKTKLQSAQSQANQIAMHSPNNLSPFPVPLTNFPGTQHYQTRYSGPATSSIPPQRGSYSDHSRAPLFLPISHPNQTAPLHGFRRETVHHLNQPLQNQQKKPPTTHLPNSRCNGSNYTDVT